MVTYTKILFCTDFSEGAQAAVPVAVDLAKKYGAELHVLHVYREAGHIAEFEISSQADTEIRMVQPPGTEVEKRLDTLCEAISAELGSCRRKMLRGKAGPEIIRYAKEAGIDVIVMSSHGLSGLEHALFGSTAERVLRESPCNVFIVKKRGQ